MAGSGGFPAGVRGGRFASPAPPAGGEDEFKSYRSGQAATVLLPIDIAGYIEVDEHGEAYGGVHMDYPGRAKVFQRINTSG